jgi:hypothetical protein
MPIANPVREQQTIENLFEKLILRGRSPRKINFSNSLWEKTA